MKKWLIVGLAALSLAKASPADVKHYFKQEVGPKAEWVTQSYYEKIDRALSAYHPIKCANDVKIALNRAPLGIRANVHNMIYALKNIERAKVKINIIKASTLQYYRVEDNIRVLTYENNKINAFNMPLMQGYQKGEAVAFIDWYNPKAAYFLGAAIIENAFKGLVSVKYFTSAFLEHLGNAYKQLHSVHLSKLLPRPQRISSTATTRFIIKLPKPEVVARELEKRFQKRPAVPSKLSALFNSPYFSSISLELKNRIEKNNRARFLEVIETKYRGGLLTKNEVETILSREGYSEKDIQHVINQKVFSTAPSIPKTKKIKLF